jgi:error-prone DNA polymerase
MSYVPLWCKSNYSFLEGASHPDEMVEQAVALGLPAIGITDRDGVYGIVQAHQAARENDGRIIIGSEMTIESEAGSFPLVVLAKDMTGYRNLCSLISAGRLRSPKGESTVSLAEVCDSSSGLLSLWVTDTLRTDDEESVLSILHETWPTDSYLIAARHLRPEDKRRHHRLTELSGRLGTPLVAATEVLYHIPERRELHDVLQAIRLGVTLDETGRRLKPNASHSLLSAEEMNRRYRDTPELVTRTHEVAEKCTFSLDQIDYRYPCEQVPHGYTTMEWLWELTFAGARKRYGGSIPADVRSQLQKELGLIDELEYAGYFLTMWEIVEYCRRKSILCQGRGSAANSAVCYCLGITAIDPVRMDLLFERFLSRERAEPPDIDLDIEHRRREEVIQHIYRKYGRDRAAMVANVIRYRLKSAIRDVGKALGFPATALDRMAKLASSYGDDVTDVLGSSGVGERARERFARLVEEILRTPRHLSIHPGGFILGSEPVHTLVPIENATMPDRTVIQWDKYDVEAMGLFKVDLLGLGALTHLDYSFHLLKQHRAVDLSMATIPHDDAAVFQMVSRGDTVGVFQLESRAQMAMLPRLRPRTWYDLVIEVSIVRPGPITGGMVHPYLRRRAGEEPVIYAHPALEPVLRKTLGVPIFQEQVMKLAVVAADYTPGEADQLRRDMAAWRLKGKIGRHHDRFVGRMVAKGIAPEFAEAVFEQIKGFGEYGFPESHAASFSLIAYCTAWLRTHYPAEFICGLLNAWPMGFYSPASIVEDAKRHGVQMRSIDVTASDWDCTLERIPGNGRQEFAVRMGLRFVKGIREADYRRIVQARPHMTGSGDVSQPRVLLHRFSNRTRLNEDLLVALARSGAFGCFGIDRRQALWEVSGTAVRRAAEDLSPKGSPEEMFPLDDLSKFDPLSDLELVAWDYYTSSHSVRAHPLEPHREALTRAGHPSSHEVWRMEDGEQTTYVGLVITRQRPQTAGGTVFITLEDETGYVNLVVWKSVFQQFRSVLLTAAVLGVEGRIQAADGVVHLVVERCFKPQLSVKGFRIESRDFR